MGSRPGTYRDIRFEVPASWGYAKPPDSSYSDRQPVGAGSVGALVWAGEGWPVVGTDGV